MSSDEIATLAASLFTDIEAGDLETVRDLYAADAVVWHDFDNMEETAEHNLAVLGWMIRPLTNRWYEDVRRINVDDGLVEQPVLRGDRPGGRREMPAVRRVVVAEGCGTRVEECLDSVQATVLRRRQPAAPSTHA